MLYLNYIRPFKSAGMKLLLSMPEYYNVLQFNFELVDALAVEENQDVQLSIDLQSDLFDQPRGSATQKCYQDAGYKQLLEVEGVSSFYSGKSLSLSPSQAS